MSEESRKAFNEAFPLYAGPSPTEQHLYYAEAAYEVWLARDAEIAALKEENSLLADAGLELETELVAMKEEIEPLRVWYAESHRIIDAWDTKCSALKARVGELEAQSSEDNAGWSKSISWASQLYDERDALARQIYEHGLVCAGVWVPVGERLPTDGRMYPVLADRGLDEDCYHENGDTFDGWQFCKGHTHWLDVKLPGATP